MLWVIFVMIIMLGIIGNAFGPEDDPINYDLIICCECGYMDHQYHVVRGGAVMCRRCFAEGKR